eukprot:1160252-Pelagomonas_calceolata.AAC.5
MSYRLMRWWHSHFSSTTTSTTSKSPQCVHSDSASAALIHYSSCGNTWSPLPARHDPVGQNKNTLTHAHPHDNYHACAPTHAIVSVLNNQGLIMYQNAASMAALGVQHTREHVSWQCTARTLLMGVSPERVNLFVVSSDWL